MTEQARPFKGITRKIETLDIPAVKPDSPVDEAYDFGEELSGQDNYRPNRSQPETTVLDKFLAAGWVNWEVLAWVGLIALAIFSRYYDLAPRAMHHDESIHAKFSYDMYKGISIFRYDPTWHGPVLYYMVSLSYFILGGASEFSARFSPALFGVGLIAISWFLRPLIGRIGAFAFGVLMLVSPSVLYYSRSLRHDIFATFGFMLFLIGLFRFAQDKNERKTGWLVASGIGFFLLFGSHEMSFLNLAMLLMWLGIVFLFELLVLPRWVAVRKANTATLPLNSLATPDQSLPIDRLNFDDDDELDSPPVTAISAADAQYEEEQSANSQDVAEVAEMPLPEPEAGVWLEQDLVAETEVLEIAVPSEEVPDPVPVVGHKYRDDFGKVNSLVYPVLFAVLSALVLIGSLHLFSDKNSEGILAKLFGLDAYLVLIPLYIAAAAIISLPLARLINYTYGRLNRTALRVAIISAVVVGVLLAAVATLLFIRGKSPVEFITAANVKLFGYPTAPINQIVDAGFQPYSIFSYIGLSWYSLLPQLVAVGIVAVLAGALAGWVWQRGLLVYSARGRFSFVVTFFFVLILATLISLRFMLGLERSALPKVSLPLVGTIDKWLGYVLGGAVIGLVIALVAGWFVSMAEKLSDGDLRGSAVLRAVLRFARNPWAPAALLLAFGVPYVLIFSNFFFSPERLADGFYRGIEYWGEQHDKRRLDQPWFYYPMLMLLYETFAVFMFFVGLVFFSRTFWQRTASRQRMVFSVKGIFIGFAFWWAVVAMVLYSIAGEKIPWLNMQMAVPFSLVAAAFLNDALRRLDWKSFFNPRGGLLFGGLLTLSFAAVLVMVGMAINFPRQGLYTGGIDRLATSTDVTIAAVQLILVGAIGLAMFGVCLWLWWSNRLSSGIARAWILAFFGVVLAVYCLKSTIALNFDHPDVAVEPMIYTQTTPEVPLFVERLGRLSRDIRDSYKTVPAQPTGNQVPAIYPDPANAKGIPLYVSSETAWPLSWYLREYTDVCWCTITPNDSSPVVLDRLTDARGNNYAVIMVSTGENTAKLQQQLQGQYTSHQYRFRWHFPEDDSGYGGLGYVPPSDPREYRVAVKDITNTRWDMFYRSFTEQPFAARLWRFLAYRELWQPLGSFDMVVWVRNDLNPDFALTNNTSLTPGFSNPATGTNPDNNASFDLTASSTAGNLNGQYRTPRNLAVAPDGSFVVLDSLNARVQRFDKDGKFLGKFGTIGNLDGQFTLAQFESGPGGIVVDEDGNIYVADTWGYRIQKFDSTGKFLAKWGSGGQDTQGDAARNQAAALNFYGPRSIAYDSTTKNLFITDTGNKRILVYDREGNFQRQFGSRGPGPGLFDEPVAVAISPAGLLYVTDLRNRRVQILDKNGVYQSEIPIPSWKDAILGEPYLAFSAAGDLYVTDPVNGSVLRFDSTGKQTNTYNSNSGIALINPMGLAFDQQGNLYVADGKRNAIVKFTP